MASAADVKKLREATSAGILDCKKALDISDGDYDKAYRYIREQGSLKAEKKSDRVAANGVVLTQHGSEGAVMVEINCETDFVARNVTFQAFVKKVLDTAFTHKAQDAEQLKALANDGVTIEQERKDLIASIGENIIIRRCVYIACASASESVVSYQHGTRIGVLVRWLGGDMQMGEEIAMHIAAAAPIALHASDIPADILEQERSIAAARVAQMGKPEHIAASILDGMVAKFVDAQMLGGQEFIMDPKLKIADVLKNKKAEVKQFVRYALGEGIEIVEENFQEAIQAIHNQNKADA